MWIPPEIKYFINSYFSQTVLFLPLLVSYIHLELLFSYLTTLKSSIFLSCILEGHNLLIERVINFTAVIFELCKYASIFLNRPH